MGGIGIQQFFIVLFTAFASVFHRDLHQQPNTARNHHAKKLLYVLYLVLILITVRIIFRLAEYAKASDSTMPKHEAYQYFFDSTPMLIALILFNIAHPGRIMPGKESDFPNYKERKAFRQQYGRDMHGRGEPCGLPLPLSETSPDHEKATKLGEQHKNQSIDSTMGRPASDWSTGDRFSQIGYAQ